MNSFFCTELYDFIQPSRRITYLLTSKAFKMTILTPLRQTALKMLTCRWFLLGLIANFFTIQGILTYLSFFIFILAKLSQTLRFFRYYFTYYLFLVVSSPFKSAISDFLVFTSYSNGFIHLWCMFFAIFSS